MATKKAQTPKVQMTTKKAQQHLPKFLDKTFDTSTDPSVIEEKLFGHDENEHADDDGPVVFICGKCKLPVGDSLSWDGSEDSQNQILLKKITDNVVVGKEKRLYEPDKKSPCLIVDLICQGCRSVIGMVYSSTPKQLDHKRFTFCLSVADIDSYVLGSAKQMLSAEGPDEQPVTLEYKGRVEQQLKELHASTHDYLDLSSGFDPFFNAAGDRGQCPVRIDVTSGWEKTIKIKSKLRPKYIIMKMMVVSMAQKLEDIQSSL